VTLHPPFGRFAIDISHLVSRPRSKGTSFHDFLSAPGELRAFFMRNTIFFCNTGGAEAAKDCDGRTEISPKSETDFIPEPSDTDLRLTFVRNRKGKTTGVIVHWNGIKIRGARISDQPAR
jgi:hypothetical protein